MKPAQRLARRGDFRRVMQGQRLLAGRTLVAFAVPATGATSRVGVTTSRQLRPAVRRNRARRRLREAARLVLLADDSGLDGRGIGYDVVLIARPAALEADFQELCSELGRVLARLTEP